MVGLFFFLYGLVGTAVGVVYCVFQDDDWDDHPEVMFLFAGWPFAAFGYAVRHVAVKAKARMKKDAEAKAAREKELADAGKEIGL